MQARRPEENAVHKLFRCKYPPITVHSRIWTVENRSRTAFSSDLPFSCLIAVYPTTGPCTFSVRRVTLKPGIQVSIIQVKDEDVRDDTLVVCKVIQHEEFKNWEFKTTK